MGCGSSAAKDPSAAEQSRRTSALEKEGSVKKVVGVENAEGATNAEDAKTPANMSPGPSPQQEGDNKKKKDKKKKKRRGSGDGGMMTKLALQFPIIKKSFDLVKKVFDAYHVSGLKGPKDAIQVDRLKDVLEHVGEHKTFTDEEVKELFHVSDLTGSMRITFKEFLIAIAMGYFLKVNSTNEEFLEIQRGFKIVEKAFHEMDEDGGGSVDRGELKKALFAGSLGEDDKVLEHRLNELDFDGGGDVDLPEFMYGMISWVGFQEELADSYEKK